MSKPDPIAGQHDVASGVKYDAAHANAYERKIRALIPGYALLHELLYLLVYGALCVACLHLFEVDTLACYDFFKYIHFIR